MGNGILWPEDEKQMVCVANKKWLPSPITAGNNMLPIFSMATYSGAWKVVNPSEFC